MEKSYVSITTYDCPLCDKEHSNRAEILLDTRLKDSLEPKTKAGLRICEDCEKENYGVIIECLQQDSEGMLLGRYAYVLLEALEEGEFFDLIKQNGFILCDTETMNELYDKGEHIE